MEGNLTFEAIGTTWHITTPIQLTPSLQKQIQTCIDDFDRSYSRFRPDSLITQMSQEAGEYKLPDDAKPLFDFYQTLYTLTKGDFTPLIGQLLVDAGYDASYSLQPKQLQNVLKWEEAIAYVFPNLQVKQPVLLDFGAAGKGYLIDEVGEILSKNLIKTFRINAGGDILYKSTEKKKLRIGLEHPQDTTKVIGVAEIEQGSICGSSGNRRAWKQFHHIMHPVKKASVSHILSVWVIAETGLLADGLATALFFVKPEVLAKKFTFEYVLMHQDYSLDTSKNFPAEFY